MHEAFVQSEIVIYIDKKNDWSGPGNVLSKEGNTLFIHSNVNVKRVAKCNMRNGLMILKVMKKMMKK